MGILSRMRHTIESSARKLTGNLHTQIDSRGAGILAKLGQNIERHTPFHNLPTELQTVIRKSAQTLPASILGGTHKLVDKVSNEALSRIATALQ
jgi:hypothetical protein